MKHWHWVVLGIVYLSLGMTFVFPFFDPKNSFASASSTSLTICTAQAENTDTGTRPWFLEGGEITASDDTYATVNGLKVSRTYSYYLYASDFNFDSAVESGDDIDWIYVEVHRRADIVSCTTDEFLYLVDSTGTRETAVNKADTSTTWGNTESTATYNWTEAQVDSCSIDADDVRSVNFGVMLATDMLAGGALASSSSVDCIYMRVGYTEASAWNNRVPVVSSWSPTNGTTTTMLYPTTSATVSDKDGNESLICMWYAPPSSTFASPSSWTKAQQNGTSDPPTVNGTVRDMNSSYVNIYGYYYWWKVTAYDGRVNSTNGTKWFRTRFHNVTHGPSDTTAPTPANAATGQELNPQLCSMANSTLGKTFNITFRTNASGPWVTIGTNTSVTNGTYRWTPTTMSSYSTKYWWSTNATGFASKTWNNDTYYFTTKAEPPDPTVIINFAGNLSDSGGPYYRPSGETTQLTGVWSDGYYTNDSYQHEDWVYINCTITDASTVYLDWLNETTWTNGTYDLVNTAGDYWEINTSGTITNIHSGYNYSFNINATGEGGNIKTWWNKTGINGNTVRRYISLNNTPVSVTYASEKVFYFYNFTYPTADTAKEDRLHRDQGPDGTDSDTGYLSSATPSDTAYNRSCGFFTGYWFDSDECVSPFTLTNTYVHFWWNSTATSTGKAMVNSSRVSIDEIEPLNFLSFSTSSARSEVTHTGDNRKYCLQTGLINNHDISFTDNNIYELALIIYQNDFGSDINTISNRSFTSFVLFNVPDNATLNASYVDSDSDGMHDWDELYRNYTNPFLSDTDNDGLNDYYEVIYGSDPNNWTDTAVIRLNTQIFNKWILCGNDTVRINTQVFNHWLYCGNDSTRVNTQVFSYWLLCGNDSSRENTQVFNHWILCGNDTSRINAQVFNHWLLCGNDTIRVNTRVFDHWLYCGNDTGRINTQVLNHWLFCGNDSSRANTQIFNHWLLCGNDSGRTNTQIFNRWLYCGNSTTRLNTQVFNRWLTCGNDSTRSNNQIFNRYLYCGNDSIRINTQILNHWLLCGNGTMLVNTQAFNHWILCGNDTQLVNTRVFDHWLACGNDTIRLNTQVFSHWLLCSNESIRANTQILNHWIQCGNESERVNTQVFNHWLHCGNGTVLTNTQVFNHWLLCGNGTILVNTQAFNHWILCGNDTHIINTQVFNHWLSCGNTSVRENICVINHWLQGGNDSVRVNIKAFDHWLLCSNNQVRTNFRVFTHWLRCGNGTDRTTTLVFNHWLSCGNTSVAPVTPPSGGGGGGGGAIYGSLLLTLKNGNADIKIYKGNILLYTKNNMLLGSSYLWSYLPPGVYTLIIEDILTKKEIQKKNITIEIGKTTAETVDMTEGVFLTTQMIWIIAIVIIVSFVSFAAGFYHRRKRIKITVVNRRGKN